MSNDNNDQGAREALVEQLAEAMRQSPNGAWLNVNGTWIASSLARAILPVVAAQVEAAEGTGEACPGCGSKFCKWKRLECESPVADGSKP